MGSNRQAQHWTGAVQWGWRSSYTWRASGPTKRLRGLLRFVVHADHEELCDYLWTKRHPIGKDFATKRHENQVNQELAWRQSRTSRLASMTKEGQGWCRRSEL